MATTWKDLRKDLNLTVDDEKIIEIEKEIIKTLVDIRERKGLTQAQLADICEMKQPVIARMEKSIHSPRIDSLLKILTPLGYTLQVVPMED